MPCAAGHADAFLFLASPRLTGEACPPVAAPPRTACDPFHWLNARIVARWSLAPPASLARRARTSDAACRASAAAGSTHGSLQVQGRAQGPCQPGMQPAGSDLECICLA